jgi:peptide chain release factor 1
MIDKVNAVINRCADLEKEMSSPDFAKDLKRMENVGREFNDLKRKLPKLTEYKTAIDTIEESQEIIKDNEDAELVEMAKEELSEAKAMIPQLEDELKTLLIPKDPTDHKNAILEIRAGAGGTEAGLFAGNLYRMYQYHCEQKGWKMEVMSSSYGEQEAIKEIIVLVKGDGVYGELKYESGVHRVQRVPKTESQGRVHTSAASVAVMPETDDVEIEIKTADLKIDVYRSSGPGGQSVNTTDSAVRITHLPTGIISTCQDEKSQIKNKARALKILSSRIFDHILSQKQAEESAIRKSLVGTGDRSAKIRTYNYPQGRVTDHRINFSLFKLEQVMSGDIQEFTDALGQAEMKEKLESAE